MPKVLGVITARGGSKGIPRKNLKPLLGKPLILYTIEAAQTSAVFDRLIISTDDQEIATFARTHGVEVPFLRPKELATDHTPHLPVIQHAVLALKEKDGYEPDYVMILQPTVPLREPRHIKEAVELICTSGADSVVSVTELDAHCNPLWAVHIDKDGYLKLFVTGEPLSSIIPRRQDLPVVYTKDGAIFLFKTNPLFEPVKPNFYGARTVAYVMERHCTINIDTLDDWRRAEERLKESPSTQHA